MTFVVVQQGGKHLHIFDHRRFADRAERSLDKREVLPHPTGTSRGAA